ncbi:hypothetical protein RSJ2_655 [Clostridium botulinum]|nr:hypothetical protein T257_1102 [Clostridium botulinum CDC_297]AJE11686.1 hypothetical protein T259_3736 [Clostridium botulinum CDC_1436]APQ99825.1 hypothetical protein RSJ2_655 [Clostridium botulinum]APU59511.1 hypothetical protein NPD8_1469 [Clostridium botulinum]
MKKLPENIFNSNIANKKNTRNKHMSLLEYFLFVVLRLNIFHFLIP